VIRLRFSPKHDLLQHSLIALSHRGPETFAVIRTRLPAEEGGSPPELSWWETLFLDRRDRLAWMNGVPFNHGVAESHR
jgi:hypothetical protein